MKKSDEYAGAVAVACGHETRSRRITPRRIARGTLAVFAVVALVALSFVFLPPGATVVDSLGAIRLFPVHRDDESPLRGAPLSVPGIEVRRLEDIAVISFSTRLFDGEQNLTREASAQLGQIADGLRRLRGRIAVEIAGYAPSGKTGVRGDGYETGLARACRVADVLVSRPGLPPESLAIRSIGSGADQETQERRHSVVITITPAADPSQEFAVAKKTE